MTVLKLHEYQRYAAKWIIDHPYSALLLDMGLGKTLTTLAAMDYLVNVAGESRKVLIIAPLSVARNTWPAEIAKWYPNSFTYSLVLGTERARLAALGVRAEFYIINRENVSWLVRHWGRNWPYDMVVIDELSGFKSPRAQRFKALRQVRPLIKRVIGLTGTPAPNSLMDLWSQMYLLDRGERLGKTITAYRSKYFHAGASDGHVVYSWELNEGADKAIYSKIDDIAVSMKSADYLDMPARTNNDVLVELSRAEMLQYKTLEKDFIMEADGAEVTAANAAVLANKLMQLANGAIYDDDGNVREVHQQKLAELHRIVDDAQGQPVLVFYQYKHDLSRLQESFPDGHKLDIKSDDVERWNRGEIPVMFAQPQSAGHGLNLQQGGHIIVWFSLTWSLEYYQQANARLDRQGQTQPVIVHHLVAKDTIDEHIMDVLQGKEQGQNALLDAVRARIKEANANG